MKHNQIQTIKLFLACDHAAFEQKELVKNYLEDQFPNRFTLKDLGTYSLESANYSDYGLRLAREVSVHNKSLGIALCGSGIGISMAVNRVKGIRGALCRDNEDAKMCKLHNNANIICFGARRNSIDEIKSMINVWIETEFEGGRHQTRIDLLDD
jgi:ribose 5-phosphate isomerase B